MNGFLKWLILKENYGLFWVFVRIFYVDWNLKGSVFWFVGCDFGVFLDMIKIEVNRVWEMIINIYIYNIDSCCFEIVLMVEYKCFDGIFFLVVWFCIYVFFIN